MKIRVYSDIHLDWYASAFLRKQKNGSATDLSDFWMPPVLPDDKDTILVLAGDLWVGTKWIEFAGVSWIGEVAPRFKQVLVVNGNHDFWDCNSRITIKSGADKCNAMLQDFGYDNVLVLEDSTFVQDNVIFVGSTLWTDMNNQDSRTMGSLRDYMSYDGDIAYDINGKFFDRFSSPKWVTTHIVSKSYINKVAVDNPDKQIVVITHHIPSFSLVHPAFLHEKIGNGYYYSDLDDIMINNKNISHWIYGHSHYQQVKHIGQCMTINNAVGYTNEENEAQGFVKHGAIDI